MAITCQWNCKIGSVQYHGYRGDYELTLYGGGNVYAVFCYDYVDENGETNHVLNDFICDKDHLKRILADPENHYNDYTEFKLNGAIAETWQIAKLLVKAGYNVTLFDGGKF